MDLVGANFPEANQNPELMARLAATGHTEIGFDSVMPVFTIIQESSALGCKMQWEQKDNWPTVRMREPIWTDPDDIKIPDDFLTHRDTKCVIDAIKILRKELGDDVAIIGKTMGPWSLGYHCFGVEPFLLLSYDDPGKTMLALDRMKEATIQFGVAQIEAGADALTLPDHATGDLVSAEYYKRFLLEMHTEFVEQIPAPIILHICGRRDPERGSRLAPRTWRRLEIVCASEKSSISSPGPCSRPRCTRSLLPPGAAAHSPRQSRNAAGQSHPFDRKYAA